MDREEWIKQNFPNASEEGLQILRCDPHIWKFTFIDGYMDKIQFNCKKCGCISQHQLSLMELKGDCFIYKYDDKGMIISG
jgi:hypothetical protein